MTPEQAKQLLENQQEMISLLKRISDLTHAVFMAAGGPVAAEMSHALASMASKQRDGDSLA